MKKLIYESKKLKRWFATIMIFRSRIKVERIFTNWYKNKVYKTGNCAGEWSCLNLFYDSRIKINIIIVMYYCKDMRIM